MPTTQDRLDAVARQVHDGVNSGQRYAHQAVDRLASSAADWRADAAPVVERLTERAEGAAQQVAQSLRDGGQRVRSHVARASDRTVGYVRDEPVRSVLMAAAAGALLFAFVRMVSGRRER